MAQVCKWLSFYLCLRETPSISDQIHPDMTRFDAIIVWKETPKEKTGGVAYEVILKPAATEAVPRPPSPPKERPLSQEFIQKKLKDAEERRLSVETAKLALIAKDKARQVEANQRIQELNSSFSKQAEKRLSEKFEAMNENRSAQVKALQDRLRDHAKRVEEVRKTSEVYTAELKERIERKMETSQENRQAQLNIIIERIKEHEKRIAEVLETSSSINDKITRDAHEKLMLKMENTLKNREDMLKGLKERLREHDRHIESVKKNKMNVSQTDERAEAAS